MARRRKRLVDLVRDGTFLARKDERLLASRESLPWPALEEYRRRFLAADDAGRRDVALELERALREPDAQQRLLGNLEDELARLGPAGSFEQLERFFPRFFRHQAGPRAGQPFELDSFQADFLREFWRRDERGRRVYDVGLLGIPKGNGKTPLSAVLGTHALVSATDAPEVYAIAGSRDQAANAHDFARANIEAGPLAAWVDVGSVIRCFDNSGEFEILSSDGDLAQGVNPSAGIVDEWWLFQHRKQREGVNALTKALHKRGGSSWLLAISTAGWTKDSQLGEVYDAAVKHPDLEERDDGYLLVLRDEDSGFLFWWYGAPAGADIDDPETVRRANPAPWVDPNDILRELRRPGTDETAWRRLNLNQWTKTKDAWLPAGVWAGLRSAAQIPAGAGIYVGVDVGLVHDSTAVAWAHRQGDGRVIVRAKVWTAVAGQPGEYVAGGRVRLELVEEFIRQLAREHQVRELVFDPRFFERSAQELSDAGLTVAPLHQSSAPMSDAYQAFYAAIREGTVAHDGDPVLAAHVEATAAEKTERGWRVRKLATSSRIDACVAAVMAVSRALRADERSVYESRPLLVL